MRKQTRASRRARLCALAASVVAVVAVVGGPAASASADSPKLEPSTARQLDRAIKRAMRQEGIPGAIVGVWTRRGSYVRTFGVADTTTRSPMRTNFSQRIGSITKTFTVTAVLQLVDQGKIGLDDPISKYVPGVPAGDQISIRQLARMQSGLFDYLGDQSFWDSFEADPHQDWTADQLLEIAFRHPLVFPPGTDFKYTNTNTVLLGVLVEAVTGQSVASYIDQHVVKPLHLDHTALPTDDQFPDPHSQGYAEVGESQPQNVTDWNTSWGGAAGSMYSKLDDMRVWARALATGTLLTPKTQAERLETVPWPNEPEGTAYGLGIEGFSGWLGHIGDLLGYNSLELSLPSQHATMVIFANIYPSKDRTRTPVVVLGNVISKVISPAHVVPVSEPDPLTPLDDSQ